MACHLTYPDEVLTTKGSGAPKSFMHPKLLAKSIGHDRVTWDMFKVEILEWTMGGTSVSRGMNMANSLIVLCANT